MRVIGSLLIATSSLFLIIYTMNLLDVIINNLLQIGSTLDKFSLTSAMKEAFIRIIDF